jgi:hypothetical protein
MGGAYYSQILFLIKGLLMDYFHGIAINAKKRGAYEYE